MKRKIKLRKCRVLLFMLLTTLLTTCVSKIALAGTTTIQYDGKVTYSYSTVGSFHVDGKRAFCMDHDKTTPSNGTVAETSIYSDPNVVKCLYYGWEGVEVWSGFGGNSNYGIVATTLALDHYVNGSNKTVAKDFIAYLDSVSLQEDSLEFSSRELTATVQGDKQVTEQTKITGTAGITLKFTIPDDVTVVCDSGNWSKTGGTVEVSNGDIIHFEAPITKTGNWTSSQIPNSYVLNAVLSRTNDSGLQRIIRLGEKDPTTYTNISVKFVSTGVAEIHKIDSETRTGIKDTVYEVKNSSGTIVGEIKTNDNGYGTLTGLYAGEYTLTEKNANENYIIDTSDVNVKITAGETSKIELTNEHKKGNLKIYKVDKDNNRVVLGNVQFDLYSEELGKIVGTYTTDVNGKIEIDNLRTGNYKIIEKSTGEWYNLTDDVDIKIDWDKTTIKTIENELKKGQVKIIKVDSEDNEIKLKDVKFEVYSDKNKNGIADKDELIDTLITDKNGEALTKKYAIRDYQNLIIVETETNKGYELNDTPIKVTLEENEIKTIKFENQKIKTKVNPHKEDRDTKEPLAGAEFDIYKDINENGKLDDEDKIVYHTVTKEDGYSEDIELEYGTYFVKEVVAPEGYTLDHIINTFSVTELNQKIEVNFADKIIENNVEITKISNNDSIEYGINKGEGVSDTYFALYTIDEKGNIIDFAKDKFGKYIGEKITINGKEYYSIKTDENGKAQVTVLYGKYLFKEIKSHDLFLNDSEDKIIDVLDDGKQVTIEFFDTAVNLELDISKTGINQAQPNDIIRYDFPTLINKSNVALDNFTWWDHLPSKYVKITKLYTGTWNEELNFKVYYKTNKNDYKQYGLEYSTLVNNCIDFEALGLNNEDDEYITDFKIVFGTVKSGFTFIEAPFIFTKVDSDIKTTDEWTNKTKLTGQYTDENGNVVELEDNDEHTTITYGKELEITTLPRTGNDFDNTTIIIRILAIVMIIASGSHLIKLKNKD